MHNVSALLVYPITVVMVLAANDIASATEPQLPDGCFSLQRHKEVEVSSSSTNYSRSTKGKAFDVMCVGDVVVIDRSIYTYGGNFFSFTDRLVINERIDTRPYFNTSALDWTQDGMDRENGATHVDQLEEIQRSELYLDSFRDYFTYCTDCLNVDGEVWAPRLPDGLVPRDTSSAGGLFHQRKPGLPPPEVQNANSLTAGGVSIFTGEIIIDDELTNSFDPPQIGCVIPNLDKGERFAIEAGGLYGGRGGAGSPSTCVMRGGGFNCRQDLYSETGLSSNGGNGGDGGNVSVYLIESDTSHPLDSESFRSKISVLGGLGGPPGGYFSPQSPEPDDYPGLSRRATGSICDFYQTSAQTGVAGLSGEDGTIVVSHASPFDAYEKFLDIVRLHDARPGYILPEFSADDFARKFQNGYTYSDNLNASIVLILATAQSRLSSVILKIFYDQEISDVQLVPNAFQITRIEVDEMQVLDSLTQSLLHEISKYSSSRKSDIEKTFTEMGGIFNAAIPQPYQEYIIQAARLDSGIQAVEFSDMKYELSRIDSSTMELLFSHQNDKLAVELRNISEAISAAKALAESQSGLDGLVAKLTPLGEAAGGLYASYLSGDITGGVASAALFVDSADKFFQHLNGEDFSSIAALEKQLEIVQRDIRQLALQLSAERERVSQTTQAFSQGQLGSRITAGSRRDARVFLFEDMLKSTFISYFSDPARDTRNLRLNLFGLRAWLDGSYPLREPYFRMRDIGDRACSRAGGQGGLRDADTGSSCIRLDRSSSRRVVEARLVYGEIEVILPIYVVASTRRIFSLPTYGLPTSVRVIP